MSIMTGPIVYIVDDDEAIRDSLSMLLETAAIEFECHPSAESFLNAYKPELQGCLLLDVRMQRMSGPELHKELNRRGSQLAIIYLTAHGDIPMTVRAMKSGAVDFMTKPFDGAQLLENIHGVLRRNSEMLDLQKTQVELHERMEQLTSREREMMFLAVTGQSNKVIAKNTGISHRTVEIHRSRILKKMGVGSMFELAQILSEFGIDEE